MNVRLLRRVKKHILEEPKRLVMGTWYEKRESRGDKIFDDGGTHRPFAKCGTAACIAGWTLVLSKQDPDAAESVSVRATKLLSLPSERAASPLFYVECWPNQLRAAFWNAKTNAKRAKVAAARIDHFIKTKGKE